MDFWGLAIQARGNSMSKGWSWDCSLEWVGSLTQEVGWSSADGWGQSGHRPLGLD